jgi:hypothetical protein
LIVISASKLTISAGSVSSSNTKLVAGSKEWVECSNRGICDRASGECVCNEGMGPSDGNGGLGERNDCGYIIAHQGGDL